MHGAQPDKKPTEFFARIGVQTGVQALLAVCSAVALALILPTASPLVERTNSAVWVICAVGLFFTIRYASGIVKTKAGRIYFLCFGFLMSAVYVLGRYIYLYHVVDSPVAVLFNALLLTPAVAALLAVGEGVFARIGERSMDAVSGARRGFFDRKHLFLTVFFAMLVCYIPCFLAFFPANINYDIANQTQQAVTGVFSTNHPLVHTLFIKGCLDLGIALWNSYTLGFMLYAIVQTLLMVACFTYAFCCIVRLTPGRNGFHWIVLLLFALYPTNHLFAITTTKDVLAAGMMLVSLCAFCMLYFEQRKPGTSKWPTVLLLVASSTLAMLLRNGQVYAYLAFAVCLLFIKKRWLQLLVPVVVSIGIFFATSAGLKAALHASGSNPVEMLSIPMQQLVNASLSHPECFTEEEQALFDAIIETNQRYLPHISDPIKEFVDKDVLLNNKAAYWKLYCSIGKKAPGDYLNAFLIMNLAVWYPDEVTHANVHTDNQGYLHTSDWYYHYDKAAVSVEKHSYLPGVEKLYELFSAGNIHQKIPIVSMLFSPGFLCQMMFVMAMFLLYRRKFGALLPFVPLIAYWVGLLLAPCIYIRYVYPIIICLPLLAAITISAYTNPPVEPDAKGPLADAGGESLQNP